MMRYKTALVWGMALCAQAVFASNVTVNLDEEHQTIRGFGGMVHNTWQGGKGLSSADAKIAFGTGDGQLGLTALRIPVNESSSNWGVELEAAKLAQSYGAIVYATPWKPPSNLQTAYTFSRWGTTYTSTQVVESNWQAYVNHLNDFAAYMKNQGAPLYAISIQNEPDWCDSWTCWSADALYKFTKNYADQLRKNGTKVISAESFAYSKSLYDDILNDASALQNLDIIGAHFYGSTAATPDSYFAYELADNKATNQERWMTEHYTESQGSGNMWRGVISTGDQDQTAKMDTVRALDVGYEIHRGLVIGNFNLYTWWYIRRCYGLIMETDYSGKLSISQDEIGKPSKRGYVLSQFSRFIRPGAVRVGATANPESDVFVSAYKKADSVVVVLINRDYGKTKSIDLSLSGSSDVSSWTKYVTSESKNVKNEGSVLPSNGKISITLDKESITTLVGVAAPDTVPQEPYNGEAASIPGKIEMEDFDIGGQGQSYSDEERENRAGAYREEGVDVEALDDGYAVGYTIAGEWLEYTVNVGESAYYKATVHYASGSESSGIQLLIDDEALTKDITLPQTAENAWNVYDDVTLDSLKLDAGTHVLKVLITGSYANLDYIEFEKIEAKTSIRRRGEMASSEKRNARPKKMFNARGSEVSRLNVHSILFRRK
ncbi:MAG: carbohydrate-binding protein [Fibrobacter sp.]|nr:carbohydrate-binding protein [Fibrobacter sp.]MDY6369590.1 carbohydrate-binding protein [Fibrobacter sp.]MDY6388906.1 carbohydrate-binding protein [Fibrobacter sp.]